MKGSKIRSRWLRPSAIVSLCLLPIAFHRDQPEIPHAVALHEIVARTPPMGWNSWNKFRCDINEQIIRQMADAMVSSGMQAAGYQYVIVDDCWAWMRDVNGNILAEPTRFPTGMQALAAYVHAKGLKFGIYTDAGTLTCQERPGSYGHELQDIQTYDSWGVDFVKVDWCHTEGLDPRVQFATWFEAIEATNPHMVLSISTWGRGAPWVWGPLLGHLWRTTFDIADNWTKMIRNFDQNARHPAATQPNSWSDPDMLEVGNGGMTDTEYRSHFSLWSISAAPLIAGNDLSAMSPATLAILNNREVIAVDQDLLGIQGIKVRDNGAGLQVWFRPLKGSGARAVVLFNRSDATAKITVNWTAIGLTNGSAKVRDLWAHVGRGLFTDKYTATVPAHGVVMLKITGTDPSLPVGTSYLSDQTWSYAANEQGPVERNMSNGAAGAGDGTTIRLNGTAYAKGLGVHAPSSVEYRLNGRCTNFAADIGVDDEVGMKGTLIFQVWADGTKLYGSGPMEGSTATKSVNVNITGRSELRLVVLGGLDSLAFDHADWANARVTCN